MNELMLSLVTAGFAWWCAMDDAEAIAAGRKIRHGLQWALRAAWVLAWCWLFDAWLLALPLAFLFSGVFRVCLNRLRGLDVLYISPWSNFYDMVMWTLHGGFIPSPLNWEDYRARYFDGETKYTKGLHRAGTIAYVFEAVAYGVGLYAF